MLFVPGTFSQLFVTEPCAAYSIVRSYQFWPVTNDISLGPIVTIFFNRSNEVLELLYRLLQIIIVFLVSVFLVTQYTES